MVVFSGESVRPRSRRNCSTRRRTSVSSRVAELLVIMKSRVKEWLSDRRPGLAVAAGFPIAVPHEPSHSRFPILFPSHRTFSFPEYGGPTVFLAHQAQVSPGT